MQEQYIFHGDVHDIFVNRSYINLFIEAAFSALVWTDDLCVLILLVEEKTFPQIGQGVLTG